MMAIGLPSMTIHLEPGRLYFGMPDVGFTQDDYGPVLVIAWWRKGDKEPIYLVSNHGTG